MLKTLEVVQQSPKSAPFTPTTSLLSRLPSWVPLIDIKYVLFYLKPKVKKTMPTDTCLNTINKKLLHSLSFKNEIK